MDPRESYERVFSLMREHHKWFDSSIPLIASENVTSWAVREALICDFGHRYAEGWVGERVYAGTKYLDQVEIIAMELAKELFKVKFADVRPISGVVANMSVYAAFTKPGDVMMALPITKGGHISMGPLYGSEGNFIGGTAGAVRGLDVKYIAFDDENLNIDVDKTVKRMEQNKPKLIMLGGSVILFPQPVKEIADAAKAINAVVNYDAAHVAGLIAGGEFQDPLREGADCMTMSTHKTLPGPQHGMVVTNDEEKFELIKKANFPGLLSNHHLNAVAALAVALAEFLAFGREYASQIVRNARAFAEALHERGFKVPGEKNGFTKSHQVLLDVDELGGGKKAEKLLEEANIIVNRNLLPWDPKRGRSFLDPGGIRMGVAEVTRLGMKEKEMEEIAEFIRKVLIAGEDPKKVSKQVSEFRRNFKHIHYAFETGREAYRYIALPST
ncbi:MAG: serine hydroxymethyltransferase [Candidatus Methanodesulfokora sp.]|nr:MAG: serine hydroxymethyltransferase [Candidatus Korarchaeota archaeon]